MHIRGLAAFLLSASLTAGAAPKPKYAAAATLLSQSHEYLQKAPAPAFWRLVPYYLPQQDDLSCSLATVAMLLNASRAANKLTSDDELVTQPALLNKVHSELWTKGVGPNGGGVTLDQLGDLLKASFKAYGLVEPKVEVVHSTTSRPAMVALQLALAEMEKDGGDMIVANFQQGILTGDGDAGHFSPVGAFDAALDRVLVLDVDRKWYEPYWVSTKTLLAGMATLDKDAGKMRGYLRITH